MSSHFKDGLSYLRSSHHRLWSSPLRTASLWLMTLILLTLLLFSRLVTNSWEKSASHRIHHYLPENTLALTHLPNDIKQVSSVFKDKRNSPQPLTSNDWQNLPGLVSLQKTSLSQIVFGKSQQPWLLTKRTPSIYLLQFRNETYLNQAKAQFGKNKEARRLLLNKQDAHMALIYIAQGSGAIAFIVLVFVFIGAHFFSRRFLLPPREQANQPSLFGIYLWLALETATGALILTQGLVTVINHSPMRLSFPLTLNATLIPYAFLVADLASLCLYKYQMKTVKKEA